MGELADLDLDDEMRAALSSFSQCIRDVLGEDLVSIILFGPWAKGSARSGELVSVMIVLRDVSNDRLNGVTRFVRAGIHDSRVSVTIVSEFEIERSTDVFPVKFLDMQHFHTVLFGKRIFDELLINAENLRLRCEQEARNTLLRLRSQYVYRSHAPEEMSRFLLSAASAFLKTLNAFFFLVNGSFSSSELEIVQQAKRILKVETSVLQQLIEIKDSNGSIGADEVLDLHESLTKMVKQAAEIIDQYQHA